MKRTRQHTGPRLTLLSAGLGGFASLFLVADILSFESGLAGLRSEALRPLFHAGVCGLLAVLLAKGLGERYRLAAAASLVLAALVELHHAWLPDRVVTFGDWVVSAAGIGIAVGLAWLATRYLGYCRERRRYRHVLAAEGIWHPLAVPALAALSRPQATRRSWHRLIALLTGRHSPTTASKPRVVATTKVSRPATA